MFSICERITAISICNSYNHLSCQVGSLITVQVRCMSRHTQHKRRHTKPPFWLPQVTRTKYPENVTAENEAFLTKIISDKYTSPLKQEPWERCEYEMGSLRCGVIAKKIGVYPLWTKDGRRLLTSMLHVSDNHVIKYIPPEKLSANEYLQKKRKKPYGALVVGADSADPREFTKEYFQMFSESGVMPKKKMTKFLISPNAKLSPGTPLHASHFRPGDYVDVAGVTIDRGFQGVVKRWLFKGGRATHGVTKSHRRPGCIGAGRDGHVWLGKKLPGHMGREKRILRGLKIWRINTALNVMWVQGPSVPGSIGSYVYIYDSFIPEHKFQLDNHAPFPTFFQDEQEIAEELYAEDLHSFGEPSITFAEK